MSIDWIEISVQADGEAAEAVSALYNRMNPRPDGQGSAVTEVSGFDPVGEDHQTVVVVRTYLPADEAGSLDVQRQIEEGLYYLGRIHPLGDVAVRRLAQEDWANAWKASYKPLRIGAHFLVIPEWQTAEVPVADGDVPIILDPGMAFGTGLHPSTQLCLTAIETVVRPGQSVLDAGCGSGILSIGAARLGAGKVDAFDIDPIAVRATLENASLNDLPVTIRAVPSAGPGGGPLWEGSPRWDVILVNILPHVIAHLLDAGLADFLAPDGEMVLAGIIEEREPDVRAALDRHGLRVTGRRAQGDWVSLVAAAEGAAGRMG